METDALLRLAVAVWKDRMQIAQLENLRRAHSEYLAADADSRRIKMRGTILDMSRLKTALRKLRMSYGSMAAKYGPVSAVEDYLEEMEKEIRQYSAIKNRR